MKCINCGSEIANGAQFCQVCGATHPAGQQPQQQMPQQSYGQQPYGQQVPQQTYVQQQVSNEDAGLGMKILCFLLPIVGIIMWAVKRNSQPVAAKSLLTWGICGFLASFLIGLLS